VARRPSLPHADDRPPRRHDRVGRRWPQRRVADRFFADLDSPASDAAGHAPAPADVTEPAEDRPRVGLRAAKLTAISLDMGPGYAKSAHKHAPSPHLHRSLPLPQPEDPAALDGWLHRPARPRHSHGPPGRTDRQMSTGMLAESPVRGNSHAGFGGRPAETERPKGRHRAAGRPYLATARWTRSAAATETRCATTTSSTPPSASKTPAGPS
jgi:hypothetical protein